MKKEIDVKTPRKTEIIAKARSCMEALLVLYAAAKKHLKANTQFSMTTITDPLLLLLKEVSGIEDLETAKRKIYFTNCQYKDNQDDCVKVNMVGNGFEIKKSDLESICNSIDELKKIIAMNELCENEVDMQFDHFRLIAEERNIRTDLLYLDRTNREVELLTEKDLRKSAIESMEHGINKTQVTDAIHLETHHRRFFIVEPVSSFGKQVLRMKFEMDNDPSLSMLIPDLLNDSWLNIGAIVASICVHFHIIYGDLRRVKICRNCGIFFVEARTDTEFCSKRCRQVGWARRKDNTTYEMIKCRERQKQFFNYDEKDLLQWLKEDCVGCSRNPLPAGGQCTRWVDKFGEEEIGRRLQKREKG